MRVLGSRMDLIEMERESRERLPEKGEERVRRAEAWMVEALKSR